MRRQAEAGGGRVRFLGIIYEEGYLQTWGFACRLKKLGLYRIAQFICGKVTSHEPSKTEWGYGGSAYGDVWCRWCNKIGSIPRSELNRFEHARSTIWGATGCDISKKDWGPPT